MLEVISIIISCILQTVSCAYVVGNLMNRKTILKRKTNILILLIVTLLFYSFMSMDMGISKPLLIYLIVIVAFKYFYDISFNESVIVNFISMILNCIGEVIVTLTVVLFKTPQHVIDKYLVNTPISLSKKITKHTDTMKSQQGICGEFQCISTLISVLE